MADATVADGTAALDAAVAAQADWAATPPRDRGEILRSAFESITERADEIALLMTLEMGKTIDESKAEITYGAEFFRWFSEEAVRVAGRYSTAPNGATRLLTLKQPVGPCLMITPWNFPLAMGTRKIGPAIAAGCTMVVKPAGLTPLTMLWLAQVLADAGLPDGVLNVVTTSRTGDVMEPIIRDPRLRKLTFTGSTGVGRRLVEQSAEGLLRVSMELGGNAPFLVFDDADVDAAVDGAMLAKMRNIGEACTAANRFIVHESVAPASSARSSPPAWVTSSWAAAPTTASTSARWSRRSSATRWPSSSTTPSARGPQCSPAGRPSTATAGSTGPPCSPTCPRTPGVRTEEIFGPVAPIITFTDEDEALRIANDTEYGLVAYAFTRDVSRVVRIYEGLETGHGRHQPGHRVEPGGPVRRRQGVRVRPRGRHRGHRGVPRDEVRRPRPPTRSHLGRFGACATPCVVLCALSSCSGGLHSR